MTPPSSLTLLTWNVQWFCGLDGVVDARRVLDHARAFADFDVLCLQEVAVNYPALRGGAGFDQVQRVRDLLPGFEVAFGAAVDELGRDGTRRRFGNLIASRLPVAQWQHHALPYPAEAGVPSMPRGSLVATVLAPWGPLRVMCTHLEYYSKRMRHAQAQALLDLHAQACALSAAPPAPGDEGTPFASRPHTASALLCGDFNLALHEPEHALLQQAVPPPATRFVDAWPLVRGPEAPRAPTFCVHDREYGDAPYACDFVFASEDLAPRVRRVEVDLDTRLSDHQPLAVMLS